MEASEIMIGVYLKACLYHLLKARDEARKAAHGIEIGRIKQDTDMIIHRINQAISKAEDTIEDECC